MIEFDNETNVWYFPGLWHGDPPMAHINPGYTGQVLEMKDILMLYMNTKRTTFLSISEICNSIDDLWSAILADDFVFSFRNSIEVKVYNEMETDFQKLSRELQKFTSKLVATITNALNGKETPEDVSDQVLSFKVSCLSKQHKIEEKLTKYFNKTHKGILIQWKDSRFNLFKDFLSTLCGS